MRSRETEEKRQHSTAAVPYSSYECRIPELFMNVPMHWHGEFEINRILKGCGEFICGDARFIASEGDLLILPPNMLHAAYRLENCELIYDALVFSPVMLGANVSDRSTTECIRPIINGSTRIMLPISPVLEGYHKLRSVTDRIFDCAHSNRPQSDLLLKSELMRLFWLLDNDSAIICRTPKQEQETSHSEAIRPALEFMMENYREPITIKQLADLVHLSKSYFMGCFKSAVGVSAIEHLTHLRIDAACKELSDTNKMISDIAFGCGYSNLSNFNRQFRKIVGCSPKDYRNSSSPVRSLHGREPMIFHT